MYIYIYIYIKIYHSEICNIHIRIWTGHNDIGYRINAFLENLVTSCRKRNVHGHPTAFVDVQEFYAAENRILDHQLDTHYIC